MSAPSGSAATTGTTGVANRWSSNRWAPYVLAGVLLLADFLWLSRGLSRAHSGAQGGIAYQTWALDHSVYSDIIKLSLVHYLVQAGHVTHALPYVHGRIEYPVLLGFTLWLPTWLPGGPASWFAAAGVLTAAATFGSIALLQRQRPSSVWWIAASPALLLDSAINWDLIGIVFLVAAVVWFGERRYASSGAASAVGTCFKLFPVVVAPAAAAALAARWYRAVRAGGRSGGGSPDANDRRGAWRPLARWLIPFGVVGAVVMGPLLIVARYNTLWFVRFNSLRPQKDAVWGIVAKAAGTAALPGSVINAVSLLAVGAVMAYGAWMVWRTPSTDHSRAVALASALTIVVWMGVNKIWNPQYVLWVFAAAGLVGMPARYGVALGAVSVYDYWFEFVLRVPSTPVPYPLVDWSDLGARLVLFALIAVWMGRQLHLGAISPPEGASERSTGLSSSDPEVPRDSDVPGDRGTEGAVPEPVRTVTPAPSTR